MQIMPGNLLTLLQSRQRTCKLNQKGGKNIAFPTALLVIRILCIPELVSQLDVNVWSIKQGEYQY